MDQPFSWIDRELEVLENEGLLRTPKAIDVLPGGKCRYDGRVLDDFAGNDYLGLSQDSRVKQAAINAIVESGTSATASPATSGRHRWMVELEERLADFEQTESALVFPTGYAANLATLVALADSETTVFCDRFNHASLVDGCRLSGGRLRVFRHTELDRLESELKRLNDSGRRLIVTDSVFSMDGDLAPLTELSELSRRYNAILVVDEAHGTGVFGNNGEGVCDQLEISTDHLVKIGTLSKALGSQGGFVVGGRSLMTWIWNRGRNLMYSTGLAPANCAAASQAIEILQTEPALREKLWQNCNVFRQALRNQGIPVLEHSQGPIVPILGRTPESVLTSARHLIEQGFLVSAIRPPTVPNGTSRLRISLSAAHSELVLNRLATSLCQVQAVSIHHQPSLPTI